MRYFAVAGRSANTAATADHVAVQLWNPSATRSVWVVEIHIQKSTTATLDNHGIAGTTARGATPTTTVTPDLDNDFEWEVTPASACVLELATFSSQPTLGTPYLYRGVLPAAIGSAVQYVFPGNGLKLKPASGLAVATPVAVILMASDFTFVFHE